MNNNSSNKGVSLSTGTNPAIKFGALFVLVLQNASLVLVMRYSQIYSDHNQPQYLASTAVFLGELFKLIVSIVFLWSENRYNLTETLSQLGDHLKILTNFRDLGNLSVPAFLYVVQNNLVYLATAHLDPAPFQLLFQLKIFTTAILSVLLLKRVLTQGHWQSLAMLFVGVVIVQMSTLESKQIKIPTRHEQNPMLGLMAVLLAVTCSGLSGVWFEKILKGSLVSLWVRNIQLALISLVIAGVSVGAKDLDQVKDHGFFAGYSPVVILVILLQSGGGIVVAIVVKYADNILKGFATSAATVLSTVASVFLFGFNVSVLFSIGAGLVLGSAYMYNAADMQQQRVTPKI